MASLSVVTGQMTVLAEVLQFCSLFSALLAF